MTQNDPKQNTDTELYREEPKDYYANSIFVTEDGRIGMDVGGLVIVKPIAEWHNLATQRQKTVAELAKIILMLNHNQFPPTKENDDEPAHKHDSFCLNYGKCSE